MTMILNRIASQLGKRDWGTAFVEILIVVVGIFLGLQVDEWNDGRKERIRESRYLERLAEDLDSDIQEFESILKYYDERQEMVDFLLESVNNPEIVRSRPSYFIVSVLQASFTTPPVISNHTFEELKFSGDLAIIEDESVRSSLTMYYANIDRYDEYAFGRESRKLRYGDASLGILAANQVRTLETGTGRRRVGRVFSCRG